MGKSRCCEEMGLKKGPWTPHEDHILVNYIKLHGHINWRALPKLAGLLRCGKSCRLRWTNYLSPHIKRGNFTLEEEETILMLHELLGNRWSAIAAKLPGRTDNEIKNIWHTHLKKRVLLNPNSNSNQIVSISTVHPVVRERVRNYGVDKMSEFSKKSKVQNDDKNDNDNSEEHEYSERPSSFVKNEQFSPRPCVSSSEMSTLTSTSSTNDTRGNEMARPFNFGDFTKDINDDFWLGVLSVEDTTMSYDQEHLQRESVTLLDHKFESQVNGDELNLFWHSLLTTYVNYPIFRKLDYSYVY